MNPLLFRGWSCVKTIKVSSQSCLRCINLVSQHKENYILGNHMLMESSFVGEGRGIMGWSWDFNVDTYSHVQLTKLDQENAFRYLIFCYIWRTFVKQIIILSKGPPFAFRVIWVFLAAIAALYVVMSVCRLVCPSVCLSVRLSVGWSVCLLVCPSVGSQVGGLQLQMNLNHEQEHWVTNCGLAGNIN